MFTAFLDSECDMLNIIYTEYWYGLEWGFFGLKWGFFVPRFCFVYSKTGETEDTLIKD